MKKRKKRRSKTEGGDKLPFDDEMGKNQKAIHPSGNVKPSKEDMIVTRKLQKCGQLLGIELLDHIIVGGTNGKMLSFREEKMLNVTGRMDWER